MNDHERRETAAHAVLDRVLDRDADPEDRNVAVVLAQTGDRADAHRIDALDGSPTVADLNPDHPPDAPVVMVAFEADLDRDASGWRAVPRGDLTDRLAATDVSVYAYPATRLEAVEVATDGGHTPANNVFYNPGGRATRKARNKPDRRNGSRTPVPSKTTGINATAPSSAAVGRRRAYFYGPERPENERYNSGGTMNTTRHHDCDRADSIGENDDITRRPTHDQGQCYTPRARGWNCSSQKTQHGLEAPATNWWAGGRGRSFRRTLVELKRSFQSQHWLQFQTNPRGVEDRFQTHPAARLESASRFRATGRARGQHRSTAGDRHHGCSSIRAPRRSREPFESGLTRLPSDGTHRCSSSSITQSVPSRPTIRGGISVYATARARHATRATGRRGLSSAFDGVKQQVETAIATTGRRLITTPAHDERTDHRLTPVKTSSSPPNPRWRPSTPPKLSAGWRDVYAACEVRA